MSQLSSAFGLVTLLSAAGIGQAQAADLEVTMETVKCLKPATGIERGAVDFLGGFVDGFNMVWGPGSQLLSLAGPKAQVAVGVVDASIAAVEAGTNIAVAIDSSRSPDELYIKLDGRQVWPPGGGHADVHGGQTVSVNASAGAGRHTVELYEYDSMSSDDLLGRFEFEPARPGPLTFHVVSKEEDSSYLVQFSVREVGGQRFAWSSAGPIGGMSCTQIHEGADPHTWNDNYFCASQDVGMRWSSAGPIGGMRCTQIHEGSDPHTWHDNYLCLPSSSAVQFSWSSAGPISGKSCVQWLEAADPHTWSDNYLCHN